MASPTPAPNQRVAPHLSGCQVAVKGAATAFNAHSPKTAVSSLSRGLASAQGDRDGCRGDQKPSSRPQSAGEPDVPPEVGSVKDKIGRFAKHSDPPASAASSKNTPREATAIAPHSSEQDVAARLPSHKPPVPSRKPTALTTSNIRADKKDTLSNHHPDRPHTQPDTPERRDTPTTPSRSHDGNSIERKNPPPSNASIPRKPPASLPSQLAATKPRPVSRPRTGASGTVAPVVPDAPASMPVSIHAGDKKRVEIPSSSTRSATLSTTPSALLKGQTPALPPRSNHRALLDEMNSSPQASSPSSSSIYGRAHNNSNSSLVTGMDEEALSDAIVASSLASSRASSARRSPPPPPPQRRAGNRSTLHLQTGRKELAEHPRASSPLRHTLRSPAKMKEEMKNDHRHHHRLLPHKHPHKHHEGDRKRWREEITEKARKRYEGVWAANKGLHVPTPEQVHQYLSIPGSPSIQYPPHPEEMVAKVVVRDIWLRSRLPSHVLGQVWELVDQQKIGLLTREEFVIGMWLIDQQLRGHKLPSQVPRSIWGSVMRVSGISLTDIHFSS